ncbi:MAG: N-formylglutamate amidohydrolase [Hyphomicrobiales bacterium]|nr:MAG: N-formylglutamate amidohydrolase [Hyphomicrobiales bacterium]
MNASERASILAELTPPFLLHTPQEQLTPMIFCSPHSGRVYPQAFLAASRLDPHTLRKSEDCYVDELFQPVVGLGAPLIAARFPRAYLDVNREPYELDPELFSGRLPDFANTQSARVVGGLGTIARIVSDSEEIYRERMPIGVAFERIERLYRPFHAALSGLIEDTRRRFGMAILIDCHSMPSSSIGQPGMRPHFVLGDRFGASCDAKLTRFVRDLLQGYGYEVQVNRPYAGGFITEYYGNPAQGVQTLQLEINRALYLDEATLNKTANFANLGRLLQEIAAKMFAALPMLLERRAAAE